MAEPVNAGRIDLDDPANRHIASQAGYVPPEADTLRKRVEALEAQRDEALKLLAGALKGHGLAPFTFSRGEMAELEMALHALKHGAQGSSGERERVSDERAAAQDSD